MRMSRFEGQCSNQGCDIVCVKSRLTYLVEIKTCNISASDAAHSIDQLNYTENWLRQNTAIAGQLGIKTFSFFVKVFLHNKKQNCGMYGNIIFKQKKNEGILRPNAKLPEWAQVVNFARQNGLL